MKVQPIFDAITKENDRLQKEKQTLIEQARSDPRMQLVSEGLAALSCYDPDEAFLIIEAIVSCRPVSEIAQLLTCSPGHGG